MTRTDPEESAAPAGWRVSSLWPLIYLANLAFQPAFDPQPWAWPLAGAVAVVLAAIYVPADRSPGPMRRWSPVLATVLGVLAVPFNGGASIMFVYAASFAGSYLPRRAAIQWFVGLTFLCGVATALSQIPFPYRAVSFVPSLLFIWVIGLICVNDRQKDQASAALRMQNARIEHLATLTERERISRDLHDLLGQTLTGIVVRSQLAQRLTRADPDAGVAEMARIERAARAALSEVRATVSGWRQLCIDEELVVARDALAAAGVELTVARDPDIVLAPTAESALSLALREAVTNVVRHAHARHCTVALRQVGGQVVLEVADDGVGGDSPDGNGLTGMRERITALGGEVQRRVRDGSAVTVAVPAAVAT